MSINLKSPEAPLESARVDKAAKENPDLPFSLIRDILIADQEAPSGTYRFTRKRTAG